MSNFEFSKAAGISADRVYLNGELVATVTRIGVTLEVDWSGSPEWNDNLSRQILKAHNLKMCPTQDCTCKKPKAGWVN